MGEMQVSLFNVELTLASGQFFRYVEIGDSYLLLTKGKAITISQQGSRLHFTGADERMVRELFQLQEDYAAQLRRLRRDPVLESLVNRYVGLRLMRQDLHETIIGFICSSQSNIPKIRMNLHLIAQHCGDYIDEQYHLPQPGTVLNYDLIRAAKTGYRAKFIVETNRLLTPSLLQELQEAPYARAHELLCTLPGIGPKIADCICLFALGHGEAFPVDVHILRAMKVLFPKSKIVSEKDAKRFAQRRWGPDAGLAQQFIFQWARDTLLSRDGIVRRK